MPRSSIDFSDCTNYATEMGGLLSFCFFIPRWLIKRDIRIKEWTTTLKPHLLKGSAKKICYNLSYVTEKNYCYFEEKQLLIQISTVLEFFGINFLSHCKWEMIQTIKLQADFWASTLVLRLIPWNGKVVGGWAVEVSWKSPRTPMSCHLALTYLTNHLHIFPPIPVRLIDFMKWLSELHWGFLHAWHWRKTVPVTLHEMGKALLSSPCFDKWHKNNCEDTATCFNTSLWVLYSFAQHTFSVT